MKKIFILMLCLLFVLPAVSFAQNSLPRIGIIRVDDDSLLCDSEISATVEEKLAEIVDDEKYDYVPFAELEADFEVFLNKNNKYEDSDLLKDSRAIQ